MLPVPSVELDIYWPVMATVPSMELDIYWPVTVTVPNVELDTVKWDIFALPNFREFDPKT